MSSPPSSPAVASAPQPRATPFCACGDMLWLHDASIVAAAPGKRAAAASFLQRAPAALAGAKGAHWYCKRCEYVEPMLGPIVVHETRKPGSVVGGGSGTSAFINEFTTMDPTLPHELMKCPNDQCPSHPARRGSSSSSSSSSGTDDVADVVIVRTHYERQEYAFVCTECKYNWTSRPSAAKKQ